jgi:hypothetical protein
MSKIKSYKTEKLIQKNLLLYRLNTILFNFSMSFHFDIFLQWNQANFFQRTISKEKRTTNYQKDSKILAGQKIGCYICKSTLHNYIYDLNVIVHLQKYFQ